MKNFKSNDKFSNKKGSRKVRRESARKSEERDPYNPRSSFSGKRSGGRSFSAKGSGGRSSGRSLGMNMHAAVCAKCGDNCEVPFVPNNKKPVFCNNCFVRDDNFESKGKSFNSRENISSFPKKESSSDQSGIKRSLDQLNIKLERIIEILESR